LFANLFILSRRTAPIWQQPSLVSSFSKIMSVIGLGNADADTIQTYNQALSAHGLKGHNLFLLSKCGMQISAVLQLMTEPHNLPMLVFCSLGKDRTGVISMLALHIAGASREEIYRDFEASSDGLSVVRSDIMKRLERGGLDPDEFIRWP
jgi:protein tyrosine/serine phosphatase